MKQLPIYLLVVLFALASCNPENLIPGIDDLIDTDSIAGNDDPTNDAVLWEYTIPNFSMAISDIVVDQNNNTYFYTKTDDNYSLFSINSTGELNWEKVISEGVYTSTGIMLANDKIILAYRWDGLACFNTSDGSEVWHKTIQQYSDMAFDNGLIYLAQSSTFDNTTWITAIALNSGTEQWEKTLEGLTNSKISVGQNYICLASQDQFSYPTNIGISLFKASNSGLDSLWSFFKDYDGMQTAPHPYRGTFDDKGNLFYEEATSDSTYIYSFNVASGAMNWHSKLSDYDLPEPVLLFYPGKIVASYKSDDSWGIVNSTVIINSADGIVVKKNNDIILNDKQVLLTGDYSTVVFNLLKNEKPTLQIYSPTGELSSSESADYLGAMVSVFKDVRINSEGNLIFYDGEKLQCIKQELAVPAAKTWHLRKANNGNTNSLQ